VVRAILTLPYEPTRRSLCTLAPPPTKNTFNNAMTTTPPNPMPEHQPGFEILTKHKEAIRQLHALAKWGPVRLGKAYHLTRWTISRILNYDNPERTRPTRTGKPRCLNEKQVFDIIEYVCESYEHRHLDYLQLKQELHLDCSVSTIERRLKEQGYFRCTACQKPYLTHDQAMS